jgi:hypothetical protein
MKKISKEQAIGGGLFLAAAGVAVVAVSKAGSGKTVTYGYGGDMGGGTSGEGYDYGADMTGLNQMYETWLQGLQPPAPQQQSLLDEPPLLPAPALAPPSAPAPEPAGGGLLDMFSNVPAPSAGTLKAAAVSAPLMLIHPFAGFGAFLGNIAGQKLASNYKNHANPPALPPSGGGGLRTGGETMTKETPTTTKKSGSVSAYDYAYSHNPDGTYNGALTSKGTTPNGTYKASGYGSVTIKNNE